MTIIGSVDMTQTQTGTTIPGYVAGTWAIDVLHSEVGFSVRHMMVSKVRGRFTKFAGEIVTADGLLDSTVTAEIDLSSIQTGSEQRDGHLRSPDFFDTENHPQMTYRSTGLRADGHDSVLDGELTLKGVTRQVPLKLELNGFGPDGHGGTRAGFTATGSINRSDFGITYNAAIEGGGVVVADKVEIHLEIEAILQA
jgi:polyisoprenoid-binding protein YceI